MRVPDGIMAAYPATMLQFTASPSRLLSLMDPLLPLSVLSKCVSAYAGKAHAHRAMYDLGARMPGACRDRGKSPVSWGRGKESQTPADTIRSSWVPEGIDA